LACFVFSVPRDRVSCLPTPERVPRFEFWVVVKSAIADAIQLASIACLNSEQTLKIGNSNANIERGFLSTAFASKPGRSRIDSDLFKSSASFAPEFNGLCPSYRFLSALSRSTPLRPPKRSLGSTTLRPSTASSSNRAAIDSLKASQNQASVTR
jgi:hypothetical protein